MIGFRRRVPLSRRRQATGGRRPPHTFARISSTRSTAACAAASARTPRAVRHGSAPRRHPGGGYLDAGAQPRVRSCRRDAHRPHRASGRTRCWSGSTCTSVLVRHDRVVAANVGDSRAILVRDNKAVNSRRITARVVGARRGGRRWIAWCAPAGGPSAVGCGILTVSRAFGDYEFKVDGSIYWRICPRNRWRRRRWRSRRWCPRRRCSVRAEPGGTSGSSSRATGYGTRSTHPVRDVHQQETKKNPDVSADQLADALVKRAIGFRTG